MAWACAPNSKEQSKSCSNSVPVTILSPRRAAVLEAFSGTEITLFPGKGKAPEPLLCAEKREQSSPWHYSGATSSLLQSALFKLQVQSQLSSPDSFLRILSLCFVTVECWSPVLVMPQTCDQRIHWLLRRDFHRRTSHPAATGVRLKQCPKPAFIFYPTGMLEAWGGRRHPLQIQDDLSIIQSEKEENKVSYYCHLSTRRGKR